MFWIPSFNCTDVDKQYRVYEEWGKRWKAEDGLRESPGYLEKAITYYQRNLKPPEGTDGRTCCEEDIRHPAMLCKKER